MLSDTLGLHHVSAIAGEPQPNADFYVDVLGLRFVARTVNFEDEFTSYLYYGDDRGSPGSVLTFFAYPAEVAGRAGRPGFRSASLAVPFRDPDGTRLALVADESLAGTASAEPSREGPVPADRAIRGVRGVSLHSASPYVTASLLDTFGFELDAEEGDAVRYRLPGGRHTTVDLHTADAPYGREGRGSIHHLALGVEEEAELHEWRDLLAERGFAPSRVKDRHFFHSLYVRDPGRFLFELATEGTGVAAGIDPGSLALPPWLEEDREMIEPQLPPLELPDGAR